MTNAELRTAIETLWPALAMEALMEAKPILSGA